MPGDDTRTAGWPVLDEGGSMKTSRAAEAGAAPWVRPAVAALEGYVPGEQPAGGARVVKLNTNENPYPPSPAVRTAIEAEIERLHLYPPPDAAGLRLCAGRLWGVDPAGVVVGNGSDELLVLLLRTFVEPGTAVAYPAPTYSLYSTLIAVQGAVVREVPFPPDFALPRGLFDVPAALLLVCNPNAPSGTRIATAALAELAQARRDAVLVIDEAYADFADGDALSLVGAAPNVVVLRTLSKSYSLAGLRVGFALTTPQLARELHKVRDSYNLDRLAQVGAMAALEDQATFRHNRDRVRATRARLREALLARGYDVPPAETNFVLARSPGRSLQGLMQKLRVEGVLVRWFATVPDALRITVGTDQEIDELLAALDRIVPA